MPQEIYKYFPQLSDVQVQQFARLGPLYADWNDKINVVSRKDIGNLYIHHVLHSLAIAKIIQFKPGTKILDIGSGGGFPGLPLAIMFPDSEFLLVDSIGKKLKVVDDIAKTIGLKNLQTVHDRVENINGSFDFAISRAVARLDQVWLWAEPKITKQSFNDVPNGLLYLKGGDITDELPRGVKVATWDLKDVFGEDYFYQKTLVLLSSLDAQ